MLSIYWKVVGTEATARAQVQHFFILFYFYVYPSVHNLQPPVQDKYSSSNLDSQLHEQERIITISYALASEASQRSKEVAGSALFIKQWL